MIGALIIVGIVTVLVIIPFIIGFVIGIRSKDQ